MASPPCTFLQLTSRTPQKDRSLHCMIPPPWSKLTTSLTACIRNCPLHPVLAPSGQAAERPSIVSFGCAAFSTSLMPFYGWKKKGPARKGSWAAPNVSSTQREQQEW